MPRVPSGAARSATGAGRIYSAELKTRDLRRDVRAEAEVRAAQAAARPLRTAARPLHQMRERKGNVMIKPFLAAAVVAALALAPIAHADDPARQEKPGIDERADDAVKGSTATVDDQVFVRKAAEGSAAEVELADLALAKTRNPAVKEFAEQMKRDHTAAQGVLANAATQEGIEIPRTLNDEHRTIRAELEKLDGQAFDERYMTYMVQEHQKELALFAAKARTGDGDVAAYAQRMVTVLDGHLRMARDVSAQVASADTESDPRTGAIERPGNDASLR